MPQRADNPESRKRADTNDIAATGPIRLTNDLADALSPYLLQHAGNPVHWQPWSADTLALARQLDRPIFLSVGYAACHWCHVMERESFENPAVAKILNAHFICIKVDREEHPDVDETYMIATQLLTGAGGWPMSVWLTPDLKPFYAGTYFPPEDRYNRPGFARLLTAIADAFNTNRPAVDKQAGEIAGAMREYAMHKGPPSAEINLKDAVNNCLAADESRFDAEFGGYKGAPKFPPHQALHFWLTLLRETAAGALPPDCQLSEQQRTAAGRMLAITLDQMATGGIYDQLADGFARYSTDARWLVPHFEKMLYDNAQLAGIYARAGKLFNDPFWIQTAGRTLDFWLRDMTDTDGRFYSSLDADSEGEEGKYYTWSWEELHRTFPDADDLELVRRHWGAAPEGNWESMNVLYLASDARQIAADTHRNIADVRQQLAALRARLLQVRSRRSSPAKDDKILTGWNGLMIGALAAAADAAGEPRYLDAACRCAAALLGLHRRPQGELLRMSRDGIASGPGYLEDYAFLIHGLLALASGLEARDEALAGQFWRDSAALAAVMIRDFYDDAAGGFFGASARHDRLIVRLKPTLDNAVPSANAVAVEVLFTLAGKFHRADFQAIARRSVGLALSGMPRNPDGRHSLLAALVLEHGRRPNSTAAAGGDSTGPLPVIAPSGPQGKPVLTAVLHAPPKYVPLAAADANRTQNGYMDFALDIDIPTGYFINSNGGIQAAGDWGITPTDSAKLLYANLYASAGKIADQPQELAGRLTINCRVELSACRAQPPADLGVEFGVFLCTQGMCLPPQPVRINIPIPGTDVPE